MDVTKNLIILKGECRTDSIEECYYSADGYHVEIRFKNNSQIYPYRMENVVWLRNPEELNVTDCKFIKIKTKESIKDVNSAWEFKNDAHAFWHIRHNNGFEEDYDDRSLAVIRSCLVDVNSKHVFDYLKSIAEQDGLTGDDGQKLLFGQYQRMDFVGEDVVLSKYMNPNNDRLSSSIINHQTCCIFPFGCNASQQTAVKRAFTNQLSVIQGPPGTGKTQTILNIIANILCDGNKSVLVVSNNNSAIQNVYDKLDAYGLSFLAAFLGKQENKDLFLSTQDKKVIPSNIDSWKKTEVTLKNINDKSEELKQVFEYQEQLAKLKEESNRLCAEEMHFNSEMPKSFVDIPANSNLNSNGLFYLWNKLKGFANIEKQGLLLKVKWFLLRLLACFKYGVKWEDIYTENIPSVILALQKRYYRVRKCEIEEEVSKVESILNDKDAKSMMDSLSQLSLSYLKLQLAKKYGNGHERMVFSKESIWRQIPDVVKEYPVILSTTYCSRSSLKGHTFDYVIMDEASQVSVETGVLALSVGKNVIVVGDSMQLPNVQSSADKAIKNSIFNEFKIKRGYNSADYSFLESVLEILPQTPSTLLREHYRCHPQIIGFCNQKFYGGNLLIMSEGNENDHAMSIIKTVAGNHSRGHINEREAEVISNEVIPCIDGNDIGIIVPYRDQVDCISNHVSNDVEVSTVHKFQGREKDNIIMGFTDNVATDFSDDPNLMNVAISRAKNTFTLVVSSNEQPDGSNIRDLVDYITYHNGEVKKSNIHSIFDLLYAQHKTELSLFMDKHGKENDFASECLTIELVNKILKDVKYQHLGVVCHYPLNRLIRDYTLLTMEESEFAKNDYSHIDILVFNNVSHNPVLAIETDGYMFHRNNSAQERRDANKDSILQKYGIPLLRLLTTESNEEERIKAALDNA